MEKLPKGWTSCKVGDFLYLKNGYAFKSKDYQETGIPLIRISDIQQGYVTTVKSTCIHESNVKEEFFVQQGDVLVAMSGATTGKYGIFKENTNVLQNQRVGNLKPLVDGTINRKFIYYLLGALKEEIEENAYGGAQPNISSKLIEGIQTNLPSLPEQQRIAAKLDTLFASLENTKSRLEKIPQLLKNFRQAVLTQAVTGKLTEEWRKGKELEDGQVLIEQIRAIREKQYLSKKRQGIKGLRKPILTIEGEVDTGLEIPEHWSSCFIGDIAEVSNGSTPSRKESNYWNGNIPWISSGLIQNNRINQVREFITKDGYKNSSVRLLPKGTVLIAMIGEGKTRGQSSILDLEGTINQNIAAMVIEHGLVVPEYLQAWLFLNYENNRKHGSGTGPQALNCQRVRELPFVIMCLEEQEEIVRRVESLFTKADAIEKQYTTLKQKIDTLPQALLAKAFKGELVEQLPTDGDARDLLEEIQKAKEGLNAKPKGRKKKIKEDVDMVAEPREKYGKK